jgi:hypothetical protein
VFDYFDFVTLDAGERVLLALLEHLQGRRSRERLVRAFVREDAAVRYVNGIAGLAEPELPPEQCGTPTWDGLPLDRYLSLLDMLNPMHRLWSDGRWNKLTVAQGCYWKKCSFCDISLDYIGRYETTQAEVLADRIEAIVAETGQTGFHFVDEAAPPKALKALADELLRRRVAVSWWGNVRFEKTFTPALVEKLAESGCIAISGGLEVASDRLLQLMNKGVTVEQVARVTKAFADQGILVHAYLMYGFPTQTVQDTVDALEYVRQLFEEGCIHSGFFHRFTCTVHAPVGQRPQDFGVRLLPLGAGPLRQERRRLHRPERRRPRPPRPGPAPRALQLHARRRPGLGRAPLLRGAARAQAGRQARTHCARAGGGQVAFDLLSSHALTDEAGIGVADAASDGATDSGAEPFASGEPPVKQGCWLRLLAIALDRRGQTRASGGWHGSLECAALALGRQRSCPGRTGLKRQVGGGSAPCVLCTRTGT